MAWKNLLIRREESADLYVTITVRMFLRICVRTKVERFLMLIALPTFYGQGSDLLRTGHRCSEANNAAIPRVLRRISAEFGGLA